MANQWLTGSGVPSTGIGQVTDYYRDTVNNLVYYRENAFTWVVVPAFTPSPDGIGTTWLHGNVPPLTGQGSDGDYYYDEVQLIVYRKDVATWVPKGSLDFIGLYGVQWGNGLGAPVSSVPLDTLPAGSFYLDVVTSDIYYKGPSMSWELKGQLSSVAQTTADAIAAAIAATAADRVQTGLDVIAAESARDAALIQAGVYVDEPTGRAAVADGQAFKVQGSGDVAAYEYRRTDSTTSVLIATYPSSASVSAVSDGFNFVPSRNLYDKANAVDGMLMGYATGLNTAYANGISLGYFPVVAGKTYTLSMSDPLGFHTEHALCCRNSSGGYLGIDHTEGATTGMASPPTSITWTGNSKVTFTIPSGSAIAYVGLMTNYSVGHTTVDFNRVIATVQAEEGTEVTAYQRYAQYGFVVPKDPQPESVFATTSAGLAATTSGKYFSVISDVAGEADILYLNSSGVAVEQKRTPSLNSVGALTDAYTVVASRNLYDKANAVDGMLMDYNTGVNSTYVNGMSLGYFPVVAGKTYTLSMSDPLGFNSAHALYCRDVNGTFLGIDHTVGGTTGMASPPTSITWTGNSKVTFTIPSGSAIAYVGLMTNYSVHVTDDFNRVIGTVQAEEGATATEYQRYARYGMLVPKDPQPESVFSTTEAGLAATTSGKYFSVISNVVGESDILYLNSSGVAVEQKRTPSLNSVGALTDAYTTVASRNLYDKANAVDGMLMSYTTGTNLSYANGMSLGYFPVTANKTYTVSMSDLLGFNSAHALYCRDVNGTFLGIDHTEGATTGMASPPTSITWTGNSKVTFTIPSGSAIAYVGLMTNYSVGHTTADFNRVVGTVQAEEGATATEYQRYAKYGFIVAKDADANALLPQAILPMSVTKSGNNLYIRAKFTSTLDIIQLVVMATGTAFTNDTVNVQGARTCDNTLSKPNNVAAWNTGTVLAVQGDSSAPIQYNGTYIGGNHGAYVVKEITATGHGKTVVDVGSEWTDSLPRKWYLMRIVDANKLWFVSENLSVAPAWSFSLTITGSTLNHSASATNTGAITVASSVSTQLWPALQSQTKKIMLDGITEVTADGTYLCTTVDIVNSYTIPNVAAVLTYVRSLVGGATQPSFIDSSIAPDVSRTITYRYAENGSCSIIDSVRNYNQLTLNYFGGTQAEPLEYTGKQLWQYIPRVSSIVGTIKTWDFINQENIGGTFEMLTIGSSNFTDVNNPPDRMAQIVKTSGVSEFGLMVGFSPVRSVGLPATRKTLISESNFVSAIRKQYLKALNGGGSAFTSNILPVNSVYDIVAYRAYWSAETCPEATSFIWFRDGKNIIVIADFHQNVTCSKLPLPTYFSGLDVTVIDKTPTLTLHGSGVLSSDGLLVSVTSGYGYIVLKLS